MALITELRIDSEPVHIVWTVQQYCYNQFKCLIQTTGVGKNVKYLFQECLKRQLMELDFELL